MKIALKEVSFTVLVWCNARTKFTLFSIEREVIGEKKLQSSTDDYGTTADYFFSIFANFLEENIMDFEFMTSKQIKQKGR